MILTETVTLKGKEIPVCELKPNCRAKVEVICPVCKRRRVVYYRSIVKAGHTIGQKCRMAQTKAIQLSPGAKYGMVTVLRPGVHSGSSICECACGVVREFNNWNLTSGKTQSCGCLKSLNFINSPILKGEEHPNWKGGVSPERSRMAATKRYRDWRLAVFERDGSQCVCCGSTHDIQAHHLAPYAENKDEAMAVENGATLCAICHRAFHKEFGRNNCTKTDFEQFLTNRRAAHV